jgi:hypothetical protein
MQSEPAASDELVSAALKLIIESTPYFAIQTFFGSVKKPAFANATARQAQRFTTQSISLCKCSWPP